MFHEPIHRVHMSYMPVFTRISGGQDEVKGVEEKHKDDQGDPANRVTRGGVKPPI